MSDNAQLSVPDGRHLPTLRFAVGVALVAAAAIALRMFGIDPQGGIVGLGFFGLWYDEAFSGLIALKSWGDLIWVARQDVHPPLFYLLLKAWFLLAPDPRAGAAWARLLPALLGAACAPAAAMLGAMVFSRRVGLLAGLFIAVAPYHVAYSHEVRMYSLGCLILTGEMMFLWRVARRPNWRDGVVFCLLAALAICTHYYIVIVLVGHFAFFVLMRVRARERFLIWARATLLLGLGVIVFYLPWFYTFIAHYFNNTGEGVHAFEQGASRADYVNYLLEWTLGDHPWFPFERAGKPISGVFKAATIGALLYGLMAGGVVTLLVRRRTEAALFVTGTLLVPVFLTGLYILGPVRFFTRCVIFLFPAIYCLIAYTILAMPRLIYKIVFVVALGAVFLSSTRDYLKDSVYRDRHHFVYEYLKTAPPAVILCSRPFDFLPTAFYDYPRQRTYLLSTMDVSYIQMVLMGRDRIVATREKMEALMNRSPDPDRVMLVVSDWDFSGNREERAARQVSRVKQFQERWLGSGFSLLDARLFFEGDRKWVFCGIYERNKPSLLAPRNLE